MLGSMTEQAYNLCVDTTYTYNFLLQPSTTHLVEFLKSTGAWNWQRTCLYIRRVRISTVLHRDIVGTIIWVYCCSVLQYTVTNNVETVLILLCLKITVTVLLLRPAIHIPIKSSYAVRCMWRPGRLSGATRAGGRGRPGPAWRRHTGAAQVGGGGGGQAQAQAGGAFVIRTCDEKHRTRSISLYCLTL